MPSLSHVTSGWLFSRTACVMSVLTIVGLSASPTIHANAGPPRTDAGAVSTIRAIKSISIGLGTDLPAWDLCWSDHALMLQEAIARKAIARMESAEGSAYLVEIRNLHPFPSDWRAADLGKDLAGRPITRSQMAQVRDNYAFEVEQALIEIANQIRSSRPDVSVAFAGFTQFDRGWVESQRRLGRVEIPYSRLAEVQSDPARTYELGTRSLIEFPESQDSDLAARVLSSPTDEMESSDTAGSLLDDANAPRGEFGGDSPAVGAPGQPSNGPAGSGNPIGAPIRGGGGGGGAGSTGMASGSGSSVGTILLDQDGSESQSPSGDVAGASDNGDAGVSPSGGNEGAAAESGSESPDAGSENQPADADGGGEEAPEDGNSPEDPPADDSVGDAAEQDKILRPGPGFDDLWGTNIVPVGTAGDPGFDAKVIARWDVVPHQTVDTESFNVGVVAFHINEVDRVEIFLEGGEPVVVEKMTLNPRTGVYEYWATIDVASLRSSGRPDGPLELRAIAYPRGAGEPRVMDALLLNSNVHGSLPVITVWCSPDGSDDLGDGTRENPFRQPYRALQFAGGLVGGPAGADGAKVLLEAGEYNWGGINWAPKTQSRWATVEAEPGLSADDVVFTASSPDGFKTRLIQARRVTFRCTIGTAFVDGTALWLDQCQIIGAGATAGGRPYQAANWPGGIYATSSFLSDMKDGFIYAILARNCRIESIGQLAYSGSRLVARCSVDGIDRGDTDYHPDVYQLRGQHENTIVFGLEATRVRAQGIYGDYTGTTAANVAFVNVAISRPPGTDPVGPPYSHWACPSRHVLFWHLTLPDTTFLWSSPEMQDVSVRASVMHRTQPYQQPGLDTPDFDLNWFQDNHLIDVGAVTGASDGLTLGDPMFEDMQLGDFRPSSGSPLRSRLSNPVREVDLDGNVVGELDSVGAFR